MLFPTVEYALFFVCVFAVAWSLWRRHLGHKAFLLLASYVFYGLWDWHFVPLLVGVSVLAAGVGRALQESPPGRGKTALMAGGVTAALLILGVFKYLGFLIVSTHSVLRVFGFQLPVTRLPEVVLPVGISFFVFHAISLMVDAYRGKIPVRITFLDGLLYVAFFPQLVAGPILRASSFLEQLSRPPDPNTIDASRALELIGVGLFKKVIVASFLATSVVDPVFASPLSYTGPEAWLAFYGYAAQIYCDFSGYSDMAIGSALLLGYSFPENFNSPYVADSLQDFWRRWHISLSSWLRDYLFIPLGGSKNGGVATARNLFLTMLLGGLWHGAAVTFLIWGALHGAGLIVHRAWSASPSRLVASIRSARFWPWVARLLTFHFVCVGWVLFRAPSLDAAGEMFTAMAGRVALGPIVSVATVLAISAGIFGQAAPSTWSIPIRAWYSRRPLVAQGLAFAVVLLFIEVFGPRGIAPFIYFQF